MPLCSFESFHVYFPFFDVFSVRKKKEKNKMSLANLKKFMPVEVFPLVGAVMIGCGLSGYAIHHHLTYNPEIRTKFSKGSYAWERFDENPKAVSPHFHFLEGTKANQRLMDFVDREQAKKEHA